MADEIQGEPTPPAPALSDSPWREDLELVFTDPQVRATADAFLRSKIQPRMTQLEQQLAQTENARNLWAAFEDDPAAAYASITEQLYGPENAEAALEALRQRLEGSGEQQPPQEVQTVTQQPPQADPRYEEMYAAWKEEQELRAYDADVQRVLSDPANADIVPQLFHKFVAAADGDWDRAVTMYREDQAETRRVIMDNLGLTPEQLAELQAQNREQAPPTLSSESAGASAPPPTQEQYRGSEGLHRAIEEAAAQSRRNREAPPVS